MRFTSRIPNCTIVYYLWIIVFITNFYEYLRKAYSYRAVRVLIFLLPGIEYERAKTRSVRILGSIPFSPFRYFVPPCLFRTLPLAFYESSPIRFHPISLFALPLALSLAASLFVLGAGRLDIAMCLTESFRHASVKVSAKHRSAAGSCD